MFAQVLEAREDRSRTDTPSTPDTRGAVGHKDWHETAPEESSARADIPVALSVLRERLTHPEAWPAGEATEASRFFRYLEYWRRQSFAAVQQELVELYEQFDPDSVSITDRSVSLEERTVKRRKFLYRLFELLRRANLTRIAPDDVQMLLTRESAYGLDLQIDFGEFEDCEIFYRGAVAKREHRRSALRFYLKEEFDVPIFQSVFLLFKLKPADDRVLELMSVHKVSREQAQKLLKRARSTFPPGIREDCVYMKFFKNIPRSDLEMLFPNTSVKFRLLDQLRLGLTAGGGVGIGAFAAAGKVALVASNPIAAAGAVVGLGGIALRQAANFLNKKQRYMVVLAQTLYMHLIAENRGVLSSLVEGAAETDIKSAMLVYSVAAKETVTTRDLADVEAAIELYVADAYGAHANIDVTEALSQLKLDGLVIEERDGTLHALRPRAAWLQLDAMFDAYLDQLSEIGRAS